MAVGVPDSSKPSHTALDEVADAMAAGDIEGRIGGPVKMAGLRRPA